MNNRERFRAAMKFRLTDRPCHVEHGFWKETYDRWQSEGLPSGIVYEPDIFYHLSGPEIYDYFNIIKFGYIRLEQYYIPPFERQELSNDGVYRVVRDERGVLTREKLGKVTIPQYLEYPINTRQDYLDLRERLIYSSELRYPHYWDQQITFMRNQEEKVVGIHMDGFFGYPRELMGVENLLVSYYDHPDLIQEIIHDRLEANISLYEKAIEEARPDFAFIWEDMCFRNGPLISPRFFRKFMLPAYQKLTAFLKRMGVDIIIVDSDGDISKLIPLWIEGGVTGFLPFEVRAGMDITRIRDKYPSIQIIGGIDKHKIEKNTSEIELELQRVLPQMLPKGGYCVALDHWVHSEIPFDNFAYYVDRVREYKYG